MTAARRGVLASLGHALRVTFALEAAPHAKLVRTATFAVLSLLAVALAGNAAFVKPLRHAAEKPFEFDWALRTLSLGWFDAGRRTLPIAIVEVDEATWRNWGSPPMTPHADLARMLAIVTRARPAAVVVDIDLAYGADALGDRLGQFLQAYDGEAPIIFPRRIEPGPRNERRLAATPFDALFTGNPRLHWAHAGFAGAQGVVREWDPWLVVCGPHGPQPMPAVATQVALVLPAGWHGLPLTAAPNARGECDDEPPEPESLLIGPRLTGPTHPPLMEEAKLVSALALLDPALERDDAGLFAGRIVFVGATHSGTGDTWVTPVGVLPGVELLANTVRFLPLQSTSGGRAELAYRATTVLSFLLIGLLFWLFRPSVALLALVPALLLVVACAVGIWDYFRVFDAFTAALLLLVQVKALETALTLVADWRRYGWRRTILAKHFRGGGGDDD